MVVTNLETTADLRPGMQFSFESGSDGTITRTIASIESPTSIRIEGAAFTTTEVRVPMVLKDLFPGRVDGSRLILE